MIPERDPQRWVTMVLAAVLATAGGCTICPDPFDYSGPVPNGSPPQNDFRARSNGILPLGAAPRPFPPVVDAGPAPAVPQPVPEPESEGVPAAIVQAGLTDGVGTTALPVITEQDSEPWDVEAEAEPAAEPEPQGAVEPAATPLAETPGWRARD